MNRFSLHAAARRCALLAWLCAAATVAHGQPAGALGDDFIHRIRQDDTLSALAGGYTGDATQWARLQTLNGIADPRRLPIGSELRIPLAMIPEGPAPARASHVSGGAQVDGRPLAAGAEVPEGGVITTAANGFATLLFADGSRTTVLPGSSVVLERVRRFLTVPLADAILRVERGAVESDVAPGGGGVGRFEIRAPVAVTGVRGTRFRVRAEEGVQSEVVEGSVRLQPHAPGAAPPAQPVAVDRGYGASVAADGALLGVNALLPAPELGEPRREGGGWTVPFAPVPGAAAYVVRVSRDERAMELVSSSRQDGPALRFSAPAGPHYVTVRAVDAAGLAGYDSAPRPFTGAVGLQSGYGLTVLTGWGDPVSLTPF